VVIIALLSLIFTATIGVWFCYYVFILEKKLPMDESNRVNHFILAVEAVMNSENFVGLGKMVKGSFVEERTYLKKDESDKDYG
jgi:hypothetical protein